MTDPIIDAHHHIWRLADLPWLSGPPVPRIFGDYAALRRDYPVEEFVAAIQPRGVVKSVYVQVNVAAGKEIDEVAWVQSVADGHGFPHGIVAYADLSAPNVVRVLDAETRYRNLRGIRQQLHWHEKPLYRFAQRPDVMNDPQWQRGLREVEKHGLLFELQVFASQMADAAQLARDFPRLQFVLLHAGMLEDRSAFGWALWQRGMRALADCPNVAVKLSGLGTFAHRCAVELWRPVVRETVEIFGPRRCLFGSNFPIESLWTGYDQLLDVMQECVSDLEPAARRAIFHDNAARLYRL